MSLGEVPDLPGVATFVAKTFALVSEPSTKDLIEWGADGSSIVVHDALAVAQKVLPCYFKHSNFCSFVRQLNIYGFRKVDTPNEKPDDTNEERTKWEFAHPNFTKDKRELNKIKRRTSTKRGVEDSALPSAKYHVTDNLIDSKINIENQRLQDQNKVLTAEIEKLSAQQENMTTLLVKVVEQLNESTVAIKKLRDRENQLAHLLANISAGKAKPSPSGVLFPSIKQEIPISAFASDNIPLIYNHEAHVHVQNDAIEHSSGDLPSPDCPQHGQNPHDPKESEEIIDIPCMCNGHTCGATIAAQDEEEDNALARAVAEYSSFTSTEHISTISSSSLSESSPFQFSSPFSPFTPLSPGPVSSPQTVGNEETLKSFLNEFVAIAGEHLPLDSVVPTDPHLYSSVPTSQYVPQLQPTSKVSNLDRVTFQLETQQL